MQIHLPAQSGDDSVLDAMGRGYTRESYLTLVDNIKNAIPSKNYCFQNLYRGAELKAGPAFDRRAQLLLSSKSLGLKTSRAL